MVKSKAKAKAKAKKNIRKSSPSSSSSSSSSSSCSSSSSSCIPAKPIPPKSKRRKNKNAKKLKKTEKVMAIKVQRRTTTTDEKMERDPYQPCNSNECNWCSKVFLNAEARKLHQMEKYPKLQSWCTKDDCGCVFADAGDRKFHMKCFPH